MTIGIDARMFGAGQTGIGIYIENLIADFAKSGGEFNFVVFINRGNGALENLKKSASGRNFKIVLTDSHWYSFKEQSVFPFQIMNQKIDLMHFPHFNVPLLYFGKFIVTIHDLTPKFFPGHKAGKSVLRRLAFEAVFRNALRRSEKIIAVSNYTKGEILKFYKVPPEKIIVVKEGNPFQNLSERGRPEISEKIRENFKKKYGISKPFIFYTGVWRNHKNLVGLIRAFKILIGERGFDPQLVIGGKEDPHYPEVRQTWEELNLSERIVLPGFISSAELPIFYESAALAVVPSFVEGFGFTGLEAMACGTPVAASAAGSLPEIFGEGAIYFDPKNPADMAAAMARILSDDRLRESLAEKGFEQIKKYDWKKTAEETLRIYRSIL